jgi:hypothetical protein
MVDLRVSTKEDLDTIKAWVTEDPWHKHQGTPEWWLTGNGFLSFCMKDENGPVFFSRIDQDGEWFKIHCQFAPRQAVNRDRVVEGISTFLRVIPPRLSSIQGMKGMRFDSESPSLIKFLVSRGFDKTEVGDYAFEF